MTFHETFPLIKIEGDLTGITKNADVTHINRSSDGSEYYVYMVFDKLIPKDRIYYLENKISETCFRKKNTVHIIEHFRLSDSYTPEYLVKEYMESILTDFKYTGLFDYNLLKNSLIEYKENTLYVLMPKGTLSDLRSPHIHERLTKIFEDRLGCHININIGVKDHVSKYCMAKDRMNKAGMETVYMSGDYMAEAADEIEVYEDNKTSDRKKGTGIKKKEAASVNGNTDTIKVLPKTKRYSDKKDIDVIYGKNPVLSKETVEIHDIQEAIGEVSIKCKVLNITVRPLRNIEKSLIMLAVTDMTDSIVCKLFLPNEEVSEFNKKVKKDTNLLIQGMSVYDNYDHDVTISSITSIKLIPDFIKDSIRFDNAEKKRVELHLHTKMSDMDGVSECASLVGQALDWGHKAVAITDHGVTCAFPQALHALDLFKKTGKVNDTSLFKVIYGMEGYLVDDERQIVKNDRGQLLSDTCVVFDLETTGLSSSNDKIIEIGAVKLKNGIRTDYFSEFVNPEEPIPYNIEELTGITDSMVKDADTIDIVLKRFLKFVGDAFLVAHNASFDVCFLIKKAKETGIEINPTYVDTEGMARVYLTHLSKYKLNTVCRDLNISLKNHHRAVDDAKACAKVYLSLTKRCNAQNITSLSDLKKKEKLSAEAVKKLPTYHIILLAKNDTGRVNLYKLVSWSHIDFFARRPRIPKSVLRKNKEGLIIGSACEAGELFQAIIREKSDREIEKIASFYDYLEIQPIGNNRFMIDSPSYPAKNEEDLRNYNKKIVAIGEKLNKPVIATGDVHFLNPEDEILRRIILAGQGFKDCDRENPLYFRTTDEMIEEFSYLGSKKCEEVVITNTNKIADMIEDISPVRPDKCPPVIENSDVDLKKMCYKKAYSMYGNPLPDIVSERLEKELNSIITNGFAVMYIIAQKLVAKSNEDGYLVGSRGSVGSSLVATMAGITEVNPLIPHYRCEFCKYSDFTSDIVKKYENGAGCDMPDRICPNCGKVLLKDGFNIPFETFLGFYGDKEPDIDLNFSGEYQSKAHSYTEVIFGKGHTFRAGTIATLADKTAFGYVKKYYEERGEHKRNCEIDRLVAGCQGVHKSTGQHPGGIIVLPHGEEIYSFTPVQRPANDMTSRTVTTHFDYHSIDHNLLKLDILGHDDPTMIKMLGDLIPDIDMTRIPLDSPEVMSLFKDTSALNISPSDIGGTYLGCLGIPEFGTDFAMQMVIDAAPEKFSDLIRIAGLAHGTDVWLNNAKDLIANKIADISTVISTRDDIMAYLISMGIEKGTSFKIMESVRKGKGLSPEYEDEMRSANVPEWYIDSCKKIKYMFPKAHAAAYVMMAWRIAYCKVFYPLAYYAAFFSIRASGFSYELMCRGKNALEKNLADYSSRMDTLSKKEQDEYRDMRVVQEMYARGFSFLKLDLYKAKATRFQIIEDKIMPSFSSIEGLGEKAAISLEEEASKGKFLSKEDLRDRAKISKTSIEKLSDLGILDGLSDSNQLTIFEIIGM